MTEHQLSVSIQARYYKLGSLDTTTRGIWFVLHGYGQLARYFISKFDVLTHHQICVIAPEGLSRFYLENVTTRSQTGNNRVGASWMTRENRLVDIENYIAYLNLIYKTEITNKSIPITLLGFSQGAATVSRWALSDQILFNQLILWAGIFPNDIDFEKGKNVLANKNVHLVYGRQDPFLTLERIQEMDQLSAKIGVQPKPIVFDGAHELDEATLLRFI